MKNIFSALCLWAAGCAASANDPTKAPADLLDRLDGVRRTGTPLAEAIPFVAGGELCWLESWRDRMWESDKAPKGSGESVWVRSPNGCSLAMPNHSLACVWTHDGRHHAFGSRTGRKAIDYAWSDDAKTWSEPVEVVASKGESFFNTSICRDPRGGFVLLVETDECTPFTFFFWHADAIEGPWEKIAAASFGKGKYVGGPSIYLVGDTYYLAYLELLPRTKYETRLARSKDLRTWEIARRPLISPRPELGLHSLMKQGPQTNASDWKMIEHQGKTVIHWSGGNQLEMGDGFTAEYRGTIAQLCEEAFR